MMMLTIILVYILIGLMVYTVLAYATPKGLMELHQVGKEAGIYNNTVTELLACIILGILWLPIVVYAVVYKDKD